MTAVFVPGTTSRFVRSDVPEGDGKPRRAAGARSVDGGDGASPVEVLDRAPATSGAGTAEAPPLERPNRTPPSRDGVAPLVETPVDAPDGPAVVEGYVLFQVGGTSFAVPIVEVREIVRAVRLELLPSAETPVGHGVGLVDTRGRSIPVVDLRSDREAEGDVLLPMWRHQVGLVVDRVTSVQSPRELALEQDEVPAALPSYSRGVLRPVDGGAPVLLIALPDAAELALDAQRTTEPRLGDDVLGASVPAP